MAGMEALVHGGRRSLADRSSANAHAMADAFDASVYGITLE